MVISGYGRDAQVPTIRLTRSIAGPGLSLHGNAVRVDDSGNGSGLCCQVTCL